MYGQVADLLMVHLVTSRCSFLKTPRRKPSNAAFVDTFEADGSVRDAARNVSLTSHAYVSATNNSLTK